MSSLVQHKTGSWADPSSATFDNPVTQGNLVVAVLTGRSGEAAAAHVISGTGWVTRIQRTVNQADLTYRRSMSLHTKVAGASQPQTITGAGGVGSSALLSIYEYALDPGEDQWTFLEAVSNDNGTTTNGDTISTGATSSLPGDKIFLLGVLGAKSTNYSNPPTVSWSDGLSLDAQDAWGYQQMGHSVASATVVTGGVKSSTASYSPLTTTQNDGLMAGLLAFKVADAPANHNPTLDSTSPDTLIDADAAGSYDHSADFSDTDSDPLTFSASPALPTGFSLNSSTGIRSWDGSQMAGVPTIHTIGADDGKGGTAAEDEIVIGVCPAGKTWITGAVAALTGLFAEPEFSGLAIGDIIYAYWSSGGGTFDPTNGAVAGDVGGGELTIYVRDISDTNNATAIDATPFVITVPGPDTEKPVVTLTGPATVNLDEGDTYTEQGATWTDNVDGSGAATVGGDTVDTNTPGVYVITYDYTDSAGNAADQVIRTVTVNDITAPVITLTGDNPLTWPHGTAFVDPGATAADNADGDISGDIVVTGAVNPNAVGSYTLRYNVTDSAGNSATEVVRTVNVTDQSAPIITLNGPATVNLSIGQAYNEQGATALDAVDGDLTAFISIGGDTVDVNTAGTYTITYDVSDAAGNAAVQVTRSVVVAADETLPVITLIGAPAITHPQGQPYTDAGATAVDDIDGDITDQIVTSGASFDVNILGAKTIRYNVSDEAGNAALEVIRTVTVVDQTAPVISLIGGNITIQQGGTYTEQGATASDNNDGDISGNIVIGGDTVDTSAPGIYIITYDVVDAAGNAAAQVTRTVTVAAVVALSQILTPENLTLDIDGEPGTTIKLYSGAANRFEVTLSVSGAAVDLSVFNRMVLIINESVQVDSNLNVGIDWSLGNGKIRLDIGDYLSGEGSEETVMLGYVVGESSPFVLWHPNLTSKLRIEKIEL